MPTNIDTGLTVQDAVHADHSPHIFTMSNGDLLAIYYSGTNLVWRSKSGGSWSAATTITLDTGVNTPSLSFWTRNGNVIFGSTSSDPISTNNADWFELTYTPATHTLATTAKQIDNADGNMTAGGTGYISGATANNQVQAFHWSSGLTTIQQLNVNPTIVGTDQTPTFTAATTPARLGLVTDGTTTTYLIYAIASTGTAFAVERFVTSVLGDNVESPPAPAANLAGIAGVWDGTNYVFIANENNAKLRYLTRTGTNTYGSWTDIFSDASLVGEPAVCVKANGDLAVFYRTNKNQANGEIWVVQRTGGVWGSPALFAGGAATGWSNPSCAASDLNDAGNARVVYVTGTASTWTLVEDNYAFTSGGGGGGAPAASTVTAHAQWPNAPLRIASARAIAGPFPHSNNGLHEDRASDAVTEMFYGEVSGVGSVSPTDNPLPSLQSEAYGAWPNAPLRMTQRQALLWRPHLNADTVTGGIAENDLAAGLSTLFYGQTDQVFNFAPSDLGVGQEALTIAGSIPPTDTGTGTDSIGVGVALTVADTGVGTDTPSIAVATTVSETGVGAESVSIGVALEVDDTGTAVESVTVGAALTVADTGTGADAISIAVALEVDDTGTGADAVTSANVTPVQVVAPATHGQWPNTPLRIMMRQAMTLFPHLTGGPVDDHIRLAATEMFYGEPDQVVVTEAYGQGQNAPLRITQRPQISGDAVTGGPTETDSTLAALTAFYGQVDETASFMPTDAGLGADNVGVTAGVPTSDAGSGTDSVNVAAAFTLAESGTGADTEGVTASLSLAENGTGVDSISVVISFTVAETGTGVDAVLVGVALTVSDNGAGADNIQVQAQGTNINVADSGTGIDSINVAVSFTITDLGTGVDRINIPHAYYTPVAASTTRGAPVGATVLDAPSGGNNTTVLDSPTGSSV